MRKFFLSALVAMLPVLLSAQTTIIDFEAPGTSTDFTYFGNCDLDGANIGIIANPDASGINTSATVGEFVRRNCSTTFAGVFGNPAPSVAVDLIANNQINVKVWMERSGSFTLKLEGATDGSANWEKTIAVSDTAQWVDLTFDMTAGSDVAPFTAGTGRIFTQVVFFYDLGAAAFASDRTNYIDDIVMSSVASLSQIDLPITWDDPTVNYTVIDFGGNLSTLAVDPADPANMVMSSLRPSTAEFFAGTTMSDLTGLASAIPITNDDTRMQMRVWAPAAGIPVRLKVEDNGDPTRSAETEVLTTVGGAWETMIFDLNDVVPGTAALNVSYTFNKASVFFDFNDTTSGDQTFLWDDVEFIGGGGTGLETIDLPIDFDNASIVYTFADFGGAVTTLAADPDDAGNMVASLFRPNSADFFAGTVVSGTGALENPVPWDSANTLMTLRVYSPDTGMIWRMKFESSVDPFLFVETDAISTVANAWETLTFDFSNPNPGSPAINFSGVYDRPVIFPNFNATLAGDQTFLFDDWTYVEAVAPCDPAVAPTGLSASVAPSEVTITWDAIPLSEGCRISGRPVGAPSFANVNLLSPEVSEFIVPTAALVPGATYEVKLACACTISPLVVTPETGLINFDAPLLREAATELEVGLFPNPAQDVLTLNFNVETASNTEISIMDAMGRLIRVQQIETFAGVNNISIDVKDLVEGIYVISVGQNASTSFVIAR